MLVALGAFGPGALAGESWAVLDQPAAVSSSAARPFLLTAATAGGRLVAAGERGIIFISDDNGQSWRQAKVPVNVTLTAIRFADTKTGWAVGHYGVVLHTVDGGETWVRQLDGVSAAGLVLERAQAEGNAERVAQAERLMKDGPDKPFLDLMVFDDTNALVIGAYGLAFRTADGGAHWQPVSDRFDNLSGWHLNAVSALRGGEAFIAGEQGTILRSTDGAASFRSVTSPYEGSLFVVLQPAPGDVYMGGLRGNLFHSADGGEAWTPIDLGTSATLTAGLELRDGSLLIADQSGGLFRKGRGDARFAALNLPVRLPIAGLLEAGNGTVFAVGPAGVLPVILPVSQ